MVNNIDTFTAMDHNEAQADKFARMNGDARADQFRPIVEAYQFADGQPAEARYIREESTGQILNPHIAPTYAFVPYQERWNTFDNILGESGLDLTNKLVSYDWSNGGARAFRQVVLPAYNRTMRDDDTVALRFLEWDSVDGSSAYLLRAGFYQWVCANTCTTGDEVFKVYNRHRGRPRKEMTKHDERVMALKAEEQYENMIEMTKNALGEFEVFTDGLKELATMPVKVEAHTLDFLNNSLASENSQKAPVKVRALAEHLHANWAEYRREHDNTWYDFAAVLTDYAARGAKTEREIDARTRPQREDWAGRAIKALPQFAMAA